MLAFVFLLFAEPSADGAGHGRSTNAALQGDLADGDGSGAHSPALALGAVGFDCLVRFLIVAQAQHVSRRAHAPSSSSSAASRLGRQTSSAGSDDAVPVVRLANAVLAAEARAVADGQKLASAGDPPRIGQANAYAYVTALLAPATPVPPKKSGRGAADIPLPDLHIDEPPPPALPLVLVKAAAAADRPMQWPMSLAAFLSLAKASRSEVTEAGNGVVIHRVQDSAEASVAGRVALFSAEALRVALALFLEEFLGEHFDRAALEAAVDAFRSQRSVVLARPRPPPPLDSKSIADMPFEPSAVFQGSDGSTVSSSRMAASASSNKQVSPEGLVPLPGGASGRGNKLRISPSSSLSAAPASDAVVTHVRTIGEVGGANPMRKATVPLKTLALIAGSFGPPAPAPSQQPASSSSSTLSLRTPSLGIVRVISSRPPTTRAPFNPACGLANLGNTCFMSSALQCLAHTPMLKDYILSGRYRADVNAANPLGTRGVLTQEFAALMDAMWRAAQEAAVNAISSGSAAAIAQPTPSVPAKESDDDGNNDDSNDADNSGDNNYKAGEEDVPDAPAAAGKKRVRNGAATAPPLPPQHRQAAPWLAPQSFKRALQTCKSQFAGHEQQDVQEFLAELMDALHEDLNRWNKYTAGYGIAAGLPTSDRGTEAEGSSGAANFSRVSATATNALRRLLGTGASSATSRRTVSITVGAGGAAKRPSLAIDAAKGAVALSNNLHGGDGAGMTDVDADVGGALGDQGRWAWRQHLQRNRSCVVDLFQGQLCSVVTCNECGNVSRTFDPFTSLSLPLATHHNITVTVTLLRRMPRLPTAALADLWLGGGGGGGGGRDPAEVVALALAQIAEAAQPVRLVVVLPRLADVADLRRAICAADLDHVSPHAAVTTAGAPRPLAPSLLSLLDCHGGLLRSVLDDRESVLQVLDAHRKDAAAVSFADTASNASFNAPDTPRYDGLRHRDHRSESIHLASPSFPGNGGSQVTGDDDDGLLQFSCVAVENPKNIPYILGLPPVRLTRQNAAADNIPNGSGSGGVGDDDNAAVAAATTAATAAADDADCPELEYRRGGHEARMFYDATEGVIVADVDAEPESWPVSVEGLAVGRRVDALDHRGQWFSGCVADRWKVSPEEIQEVIAAERMRERDPADTAPTEDLTAHRGADDSDGSGVAAAAAPPPPMSSAAFSASASPGASLRTAGWHVRVHFDNFSGKWDEWYSAEDFDNGRLARVYTRVPRKLKVVDLVVVQRVVGVAAVSAPATPDDGDGTGVSRHRSSSRARSSSVSSTKARGNLAAAATTTATVFGYPLVLQCESYRTCEHAFRLVAEQALRYAARDRDVRAVAAALVDRMRQPKLAGTVQWPGDAAALPFDIRLMPSKNPYAVVPSMQDGFKFAPQQRSGRLPPGAAAERAAGFGAWEGTPFPRDPTRPLCNLVHPRLLVVVDWKDGGVRGAADVARLVRSPYTSPSQGTRTDDAGGSGPTHAVPPMRNHESYTKHVAALHAAAVGGSDAGGHKGVVRPTGPTPVPKGTITLHDCLKAFTSLEELDENSWFCDHCKKLSSGSVTSSLSRLPDVLILHIKRFGMTARFREKIRSKVVFPFTDLDLAPFATPDGANSDSSGANSLYDLYAVSNHLGGMSGGHYTAFVKCEIEEGAGGKPTHADADVAEESAWMLFDDDVVSVVPEARVEASIVSEAAYLLFYRRKQLTPSNLVNLSF